MRETLGAVKKLARVSLFIAITVVVGLLFAAVPNIELITLTVFLAGLLLGPAQGALVGVLAMLLFGAINPLGSSMAYPYLWAAQCLGQATVGASGGVLSPILANRSAKFNAPIFGLAGFLLTVLYQFLVNLSFAAAARLPLDAWLGYLAAGSVLTSLHVLANTLIFALLLPVLYPLLRSQIQQSG